MAGNCPADDVIERAVIAIDVTQKRLVFNGRVPNLATPVRLEFRWCHTLTRMLRSRRPNFDDRPYLCGRTRTGFHASRAFLNLFVDNHSVLIFVIPIPCSGLAIANGTLTLGLVFFSISRTRFFAISVFLLIPRRVTLRHLGCPLSFHPAATLLIRYRLNSLALGGRNGRNGGCLDGIQGVVYKRWDRWNRQVLIVRIENLLEKRNVEKRLLGDVDLMKNAA